MMAVVTDNPNPGEQPEHNQPAPREEPRLDPEQLRQFREFQRFQEYLRFTAASGSAQPRDAIRGDEIEPWTPTQVPVPAQETAPMPYRPAGPPDPPTPPTGNPQLHQQLAGMQQQLTELTEAQRKAERAANPPLWRKILRNKWLHRLLALIVLLLVGSWVLNHYFGKDPNETDKQAERPGTLQRKKVPIPNPEDTVHFVYQNTADAKTAPAGATRSASDICSIAFSDSGQQAFAMAFAKPDCVAAVLYISNRVDNVAEYSARAQSRDLVRFHDRARTRATMSSCEMDVSGGPLLGRFELARDNFGGWQITGFTRELAPCPPPPSSGSSGPAQSTEPTAPPS
jgi:hypothetical protein